MKQMKTADNNNYDNEKEKQSWRLYEMDLQAKAKKERKSFSNQKIFSQNLFNNRLGKNKENFSTEKNNSFNALGKAGNNIIASMSGLSKNPPHLKVMSNKPPTQEKLHLRIPSIPGAKIVNKLANNYTPKNNINSHFKDSVTTKVINYEAVESIAKTTNYQGQMERPLEEMKTNITLCLDSEAVISHLNYVELWVDTELAVENKPLLSTILGKYIKEFTGKSYQLSFDIFDSPHINRHYTKLVKLSLILVIIAKFVLTEFQSYEASVIFQLKKLFVILSELYGVILDVFLFDQLAKEVVDKKFGLIERMRKLIKAPHANLLKLKNKNNCNLNEILFQISKFTENNLLNQIKNFSNSYFNYGFYQPIYNVLFDLTKNVDKYNIHKLSTIIFENVLYSLIKKDATPIKPIQIDAASLNFLPQIQIPFLPSLDVTVQSYTLVLDLDETLVHFFYTPSGGTFFIRPFMFEFLKQLSAMYEIVIFTASMKEYADNIINQIDPSFSFIKHRLYRQHTTITDFGVSKDLSKLGRDLSKTIIVDNLPDNFKSQPNNGLAIKTWTDDMNDIELNELLRILRDIYVLKTDDVRIIIKKINEVVGKLHPNSTSIYSEVDIMKF